MKLLDYILLILIVAGIFYYFLFPNEIIKTETEYIHGDTITITKLITHIDTVTKYVYKTNIDTITLHDTTYLSFWTTFSLGDSVLGTSGRVSFNFEEFKFDSISYRYPSKIKTITDTLKFTKMVQEPFYLDEWFYGSVALLLILIASLGGA